MQDPQEQLFQFQKDTLFPAEYLPANFKELAMTALQYHSISQLAMSVDEYRELVTRDEYTLRDISLFLNSMNAKTPQQMGLESLLDYANFQEMVGILSDKWKDIVVPERDRLQKEVELRERVSKAVKAPSSRKERRKTIPLGQA